jgi:hypothetical protein
MLWLVAFGFGSVDEVLDAGSDVGNDAVFQFDECRVTVLDWQMEDFSNGHFVI